MARGTKTSSYQNVVIHAREATWRKFNVPGPVPEPHPQHRINAENTAWRKQEAFKILVLGLCAGLRRGEIDRLQWSQVDLANGSIRIEATDCFAPKANSIGDVPVDEEIAKLLKEWKSKATSRFVVDGVEPRNSPDSFHYRCNRSHRELIRWLKAKGVTARNPLHSLRKEYGSIVCAKAGIYAASRLLRHANISMTAAVYVDDRGRVTPGLGSGLREAS